MPGYDCLIGEKLWRDRGWMWDSEVGAALAPLSEKARARIRFTGYLDREDLRHLAAHHFQAHRLSDAWWTIVTYMFVHGGLVHLLLNMWTLWLFPSVDTRCV